MTCLTWLVFGAALLAIAANAAYLAKFPKGDKRWLRLINALAIIYFGFVYLLMGLGYFDLIALGPYTIRPGIGLLLLLLAAEPLFDILRNR